MVSGRMRVIEVTDRCHRTILDMPYSRFAPYSVAGHLGPGLDVVHGIHPQPWVYCTFGISTFYEGRARGPTTRCSAV